MIIMENVTKKYPGDVTGVSNISLHIQEGEFVFVVGKSGSGKSTLMKLLLKKNLTRTEIRYITTIIYLTMLQENHYRISEET